LKKDTPRQRKSEHRDGQEERENLERKRDEHSLLLKNCDLLGAETFQMITAKRDEKKKKRRGFHV